MVEYGAAYHTSSKPLEVILQDLGTVSAIRGFCFVDVSTPLLSSYCSDVALLVSDDRRTRPWTISLNEYVPMAGEMFVPNARGNASPSEYNLRNRVDSFEWGRVVSRFHQDPGCAHVPRPVSVWASLLYQTGSDRFGNTMMIRNLLGEVSTTRWSCVL